MENEELLNPSQTALEKERAKERKHRAAVAGVAIFTSASLLVGGLFNSPAALLDNGELLPAVVYNDNDNDDLDSGGADGDGGSDSENGSGQDGEATGNRVRAGLRERISQLPYAVRLLVLLPMWAVGFGILTGATALWSTVLSPVLAKGVGWLCLLGTLLGAFLLAGKTVFPDLPVKELLNRRSVLGLVIGSVLLGAVDIAVPLFRADYARIEAIVRLAGVGLVLGTAFLVLVRRERKRRGAFPREEATVQEPPTEAPRPMTREEVLALADSVSRRARHTA